MLGLGIGIVPSDRLFSLNDISNLELYLKNYVGINLDSGGAGGVSQWDDSSGNARQIESSAEASMLFLKKKINIICIEVTFGADGIVSGV